MLNSNKLYYSLFTINYFLSFFNSATWVFDYEDGLTAYEKFGLSTMNWDVKIAFVILHIVEFPFGFLPDFFNYGILYWLYIILNSLLIAYILKLTFRNYIDKLFTISNIFNLLFLSINLSIIIYYTILIYWIS